ncbi:MAG: hypothetical protein AABY22_15595 [Nanoarchaeota archaeon]
MANEELKKALEEASNKLKSNNNKFNVEEKEAEKVFYDNINGYAGNPKYEEIIKCLNVVLESNKINGFILDGSYGLGKSTLITSYLKESKKEFVYINSYTTALSFYILCWKFKDKIIVIDDVAGIWKDVKGWAILRALLNNDKNRYVKYESTSDKLTAPSSFIFTGKIIVLCNNIKNHIDDSILSRVMYRKLNFTHKEKLGIIKEIIKYNYNIVPDGLLEWIKENVDECVVDFNFRSLLKITEIYLKYPDEWKGLAMKELERDEDMAIMKEILNNYRNVDEQIRIFMQKTTKSRITFFRYKKRYKELIG